MCSTSSRVPWKALFAVTVPSTSQIGCSPRSRAASADSTTSAAAPMPMIMPCRRWSNGMAASSTTSSVAAAPEARKPDAEPRQQRVGRRVVGGDHDHPPAAAGADPVLGQRHRLRGARARRVDLRVRPARADDLGELRVAHRQAPEQEAPVEHVRLGLEGVRAARGCAGRPPAAAGLVVAHPRAHRLQRAQLFAAAAVDVVALELVGEVVQAGEGGGEDDAGVVAQRVRQPPPVGQLGAQCRGLVAQHQRDAGVAQRVEAGADRQPGRRVERRVAVGVDAELADHIEGALRAGQLDDVGFVVDRLERGVAGRRA